MASSSTSTPSIQHELYVSDIVTGAHGDRYQKDLALLMFERATSKGRDFQLGYEMAIADKFDDVAFFDKTKNQWTLIQTKHADTSKGKQPPLKFEMLFPQDEGTREKGDFSLFKYLKSYLTVRENIKERKNVVIFTNRDLLGNRLIRLAEIEPRQVDEILHFDVGSSVGFKVQDILIKEMVDYVNRDFNLLKNSIVKLFKEGIIDPVLNKFKTPVSSIFRTTNGNVKFSETFPSETCQILASLSDVIDIQTAQLPLDKCKELFIGKSRNKTWPLCANEDVVRQFLRDFILSFGQPNDLRNFIDQDLRSWMRTWIRPEYFTRLEEPQLEIVVNLKKYFNERQSPVENDKDGRSHKRFLQLTDGNEFFESMKEDLKKQVKNLPNYNLNDARPYYINREIEYLELSENVLQNVTECDRDKFVKTTIRDDRFVNELNGKFQHQRFFLLVSEPGMGKSTTLEYIALAAQRTSCDYVFLFNLSTLNQKLAQVRERDTFGKLLSILKPVISERNFQILCKNMTCQTNKRKCLLIFDALDEVFPQNRIKVLQLIKHMSNISNVKILTSARRAVKSLAETHLKVESMGLMPFSAADQTEFLRQFWNVSNANESIFRRYVSYLLEVTHSDINRTLCELTGLPLMLKILAEVYVDHFQEYLTSGQQNLEELLPPERFSSLNLFEQFVEKCFNNKLMKKSINLIQGIDEEYDSLFEIFTLEHQLLAIKHLQIGVKQIIPQDGKYAERLKSFEYRIRSGTEKSPLVEAVDNVIGFIHRSYAEFLVAKFLYSYIEDYEVVIFYDNSEAHLLHEYTMIRKYFFAMIEDQFKTHHLDYLEKHYMKNSHIALWACEVNGQKTVDFLLRAKCYPSVINELLYVAAEHNYCNICTYLFEKHQVSVNCRPNGWTPLQIASKQGHLAMVKLLIEHHGDVNSKDADGWTPLHLAAQNGHLEVVKLLIAKSGAVEEKQFDGWTPLHLACKHGHIDIVRILIVLAKSVVNAKDNYAWTPLHYAAHNGYLEIVKVLIENFADINAKQYAGWTALRIATAKGHSKVEKFLMVNQPKPLHFAAQNGCTEIVRLLIEIPGNITSKHLDDATPLHNAAHNGHLEIVRILIDICEDVNAKELNGTTALHYAAQNGHTDIVKLLLDHSADVFAEDDDGKTPLDYAVMFDRTDTVSILSECVEIKNQMRMFEAVDEDADNPLVQN